MAKLKKLRAMRKAAEEEAAAVAAALAQKQPSALRLMYHNPHPNPVGSQALPRGRSYQAQSLRFGIILHWAVVASCSPSRHYIRCLSCLCKLSDKAGVWNPHKGTRRSPNSFGHKSASDLLSQVKVNACHWAKEMGVSRVPVPSHSDCLDERVFSPEACTLST